MYVYHGTNQENSISILRTGFKSGTYFSPYLDSALLYGGEYVFSVWIDKELDKECWQFQIDEDWGADKIVSLVHYNAETLYVNKSFDNKHYQESTCPYCDGYGEFYRSNFEQQAISYLPKTHFHHRMAREHAIVCPNCKGYGDMKRAQDMGIVNEYTTEVPFIMYCRKMLGAREMIIAKRFLDIYNKYSRQDKGEGNYIKHTVEMLEYIIGRRKEFDTNILDDVERGLFYDKSQMNKYYLLEPMEKVPNEIYSYIWFSIADKNNADKELCDTLTSLYNELKELINRNLLEFYQSIKEQKNG